MNKEKILSFCTLPNIILFIFVYINITYAIEFTHALYHAAQYGWMGFLNSYVRIMQNIIFFYAFLCIFLKKIKIQYLSYVIPFAFLEVEYSFFSEYIHPLLYSTHFFHLFTSFPENISPEYSRIILFLIMILVYLIKSILKHTFTNIFICLSMLGILGTAILFHTITLAQLNYYTEHQKNTWQQLYLEKDISSVKDKCQFLQIQCFIYTSQEDPFKTDSSLKNKNIIKPYQSMVEPYWNKYPSYYMYVVSNDNSIADRILSRKPIAFLKNNIFRIVIIDDVNYTSYLNFCQLLFGILAFTSHIIWLVGAFYLIYFHEKKIKQRSQMLNSLKSSI